jgi:hypothetical protein
MLLLLILLILLFGGGGWFYSDGAFRGPGIGIGGLILLILLIWMLLGPSQHWRPLY